MKWQWKWSYPTNQSLFLCSFPHWPPPLKLAGWDPATDLTSADRWICWSAPPCDFWPQVAWTIKKVSGGLLSWLTGPCQDRWHAELRVAPLLLAPPWPIQAAFHGGTRWRAGPWSTDGGPQKRQLFAKPSHRAGMYDMFVFLFFLKNKVLISL